LTKTETVPPAAHSGEPPRQLRRLGSLLKEIAFVVIGALIVSALLRFFVGQMFVIPSDSMNNTLLPGDKVIVQKITDFQRGDIVVFADPGGWLPLEERDPPGTLRRGLELVGVLPDSSTEHLIKRVIGMPGDRVICCDAQERITVNGQALNEESYLYQDSTGTVTAPSETKFEVVVPKDRIFVMGDYRDVSADSRCHLSDVSTTEKKGMVAFVRTDLVVGPAFAIAVPFSRTVRLSRPETFAQVPGPSAPAPAEAVIKPAGVTC